MGQLLPPAAQQDDDLHRAVPVLPAVDGAPARPHGLRRARRGPSGQLPPTQAAAQRAPSGGCALPRPGLCGGVLVRRAEGRRGADATPVVTSAIPAAESSPMAAQWAGGWERGWATSVLLPRFLPRDVGGRGARGGCVWPLQTAVPRFPCGVTWGSRPVCSSSAPTPGDPVKRDWEAGPSASRPYPSSVCFLGNKRPLAIVLEV